MSNLFSNPGDKLSLITKIVFYVLGVFFIICGLFVIVLGAIAHEGVTSFMGFLLLILGPVITYFFTLLWLMCIDAYKNLGRIADAQEFMAGACEEDCDCCNCESDSNPSTQNPNPTNTN